MSDTIVQNDLDFSNRLALEQLDKLSYDRIMSKPVQDALKAAKSALGEVARVAEIARRTAELERYERDAQKARDKIAELESTTTDGA